MLAGVGLQHHSVDAIAKQLDVPATQARAAAAASGAALVTRAALQLLALFNKAVRKLTTALQNIGVSARARTRAPAAQWWQRGELSGPCRMCAWVLRGA